MTRPAPAPVPSKCDPTTGVGVEPNPCTEPGSLPRCELCPNSPNYWNREEVRHGR